VRTRQDQPQDLRWRRTGACPWPWKMNLGRPRRRGRERGRDRTIPIPPIDERVGTCSQEPRVRLRES